MNIAQVWRRRLDLVREELRLLREANAKRDATTSEMTESVNNYVRVHASRLRKGFEMSSSFKVKSTTQALRDNESGETSLLDQLEVQQIALC